VPAATLSRDEPAAGERDVPESIPNTALLERVLTHGRGQILPCAWPALRAGGE